MKWPVALQQLHPQSAKTISVIVLLAVVLILNVLTLYCDMSSKNNLLQIKTTTAKTVLQFKEIDKELQLVVQQLRQNKSVANSNLKSITAQLNNIQTALVNLPDANSFQQLQAAVIQLNKQLTAKNAGLTKNAAHSKRQAKNVHPYKRYLAPTALPFTVVSIDIWNGEPEATINLNGMPDLLSRGDSRAGWKLASLGFDSGEAIFSNAHHQVVKVRLT
jgi:hypothetical protein